MDARQQNDFMAHVLYGPVEGATREVEDALCVWVRESPHMYDVLRSMSQLLEPGRREKHGPCFRRFVALAGVAFYPHLHAYARERSNPFTFEPFHRWLRDQMAMYVFKLHAVKQHTNANGETRNVYVPRGLGHPQQYHSHGELLERAQQAYRAEFDFAGQWGARRAAESAHTARLLATVSMHHALPPPSSSSGAPAGTDIVCGGWE